MKHNRLLWIIRSFIYLIPCFYFSFSYAVCKPSRVCSLANPVANFCNVNITDQLCVNGNTQLDGNLNVSGIISGIDGLGYGNTLIVDQVDGDDAIGSVNGPRFKTISAALGQSDYGDLVLVFPGTYNESVLIPSGVVLRTEGNATIQQLNVTDPTDLVTMGTGSALYNFTLELTSAEQVQLRGIVMAGSNPSASTVIENCTVIVNNIAAGAGSADVYGLQYGSPGIPGSFGDVMALVSIIVASEGTGTTRGILVDTPDNVLYVVDSNVQSLAYFGIGIETNDPDAEVLVGNATVEGMAADISQTAGILSVLGTQLVDSTANGFSFSTRVYPSTFTWSDQSSIIGGGQTFYMGPSISSYVPIYTQAFQPFLANILDVRVATAPGVGQSTTWTLQRNGVDTPLTVTISGTSMSATSENTSVHFDTRDLISMKMVTSAGALTGGVGVAVAIY